MQNFKSIFQTCGLGNGQGLWIWKHFKSISKTYELDFPENWHNIMFHSPQVQKTNINLLQSPENRRKNVFSLKIRKCDLKIFSSVTVLKTDLEFSKSESPQNWLTILQRPPQVLKTVLNCWKKFQIISRKFEFEKILRKFSGVVDSETFSVDFQGFRTPKFGIIFIQF